MKKYPLEKRPRQWRSRPAAEEASVNRMWCAAVVAALLTSAACDSGTAETKQVQLTPTSPSSGSGGSAALTAPAPDSPAENSQLATLRPTLTVRNAAASQGSGARVYEFQISDNTAFTVSGGVLSVYYAVIVNKTGIPEDPSGKTSFVVDTDLQPATKMYWRARVSQGGVASAWSSTASFKTKIAGYNRPGELFDPLTGGETIGERVGATTFIPEKGVRLDSSSSFIRYRLPQTITSGEFSMEVEGLRPNIPVAAGFSVNKPKIFGMQDGDGDYTTNNWRIDGQYRGLEGNPPNCIQFRAMFGGDQYKIEPDTAVRYAMVFLLDPSKAYFWKGTWSNGFRLEVSEGINGPRFYDQALPVANAYSPSRHVAYLGAPVGSGGEMSVIVGATYRNVWLSSRPRPASLGSALER
jgi:hypothetical protein